MLYVSTFFLILIEPSNRLMDLEAAEYGACLLYFGAVLFIGSSPTLLRFYSYLRFGFVPDINYFIIIIVMNVHPLESR